MEGFERLESLLVTQSYDELSVADQNWLLEQGITRVDYERQAETLRATKDLFTTDQAIPSAALQQRLLQQHQLHATKLRSRRRTRVASLAAAFVLGLGLGWGIFWATTQVVPEEETFTVAEVAKVQKDTVYLDRIVYEQVPPKVIYRDRLIHDTIFITPVASVTQEELQREVLPVTQTDDVPHFSRNAKQTEQLLKLVVEVY